MGDVNLNFKPEVPVFDANMALGRRHDRRVSIDTVDETFKEMDRAGVGRALVYAPHAITYDSEQGNSLLLETIHGDSRLVPQFVCNPSFDEFDAFTSWVKEARIRAVRMVPGAHSYPFRDWVVKRWLDWFAAEIADPISRLMKAVGEDRILFGSRFPTQSIAPHIYTLHHSGLGSETLKKICSGNLERLLGISQP
jgi:hypothetical protein